MKRLAACSALLLLSACQVADRVAPSAETATPVAASPAPRPQPESLIAYLARLRAMNEGALATEAARQKQLAARASDDMTRLKAALALALAMQSDESDILALADPLSRKENATAEVRAMASFLQVLAGERRRLKESATAARTGLRDERRAAEAQKQRADALQERAAQLQQKLDALTELEKSLSERSPPSR